MNKFIVLFACSIFICCKSKSTSKATPKTTAIYQAIVDSIYQAHPEQIGLMVHIESPKNGISWSGSAGFSDIENKNKLQPNQPALIASNIKTYVAAAILRLQEEQKLSIEDPISKHLTSKTAALFHDDGYQIDLIKIKHLLSHTSGIHDYVNDEYFEKINTNPKYRWTRDEQLKLATSVGNPLGKPQQLFKYADVNYLLATEIIEQKTKKPFYTAIRELLKYDQLQLNNTWFPTLENKPEQTPQLVHQYWNESKWGAKELDFKWDSYDHDISWDLYGGGGIATTMKELAQFSYKLFNGDIIGNKDVLNLITKDVTTTDGIPKIYRLGIANATIKGLKAYGHGGFWGTNSFYFPELDAAISICVLERNNKMEVISSTFNTLISELTKRIHPFKNSIETEHYELYQAKDAQATLILYPGGGSTAKYTKKEFDIITAAAANQISVLLMNFNRHLWVDKETTKQLAGKLDTIFATNQLNTQNIIIGGMSIGGNVALSLSNYLHETKSKLSPQSTFIVDSPVDLHALYQSAKKDVANSSFSEERLAEPKWIINYFEKEFGKETLLKNIQKVSPFTLDRKMNSVPNLKNQKLRFYTEPDSLWWKENRQTDFKNTNAYTLQQISKDLKTKNWDHFELIETQNKGYRADGSRHPHSWSIVDVPNLINWIKK